MNTKYHVDSERKVTVLTNENQILDKGIHTKNTEEILSLENYAESTERKIRIGEKRINEINNQMRNRKKNFRKLNIIATISSLILLTLSATIEINMILIIIAISMLFTPNITIAIDKLLAKKDNEKKEYCTKRVIDEKIKFNKIKEKIDILSKDKTKDENVKINTFIEVKPIERNEIDSEDYFISNYKIEKRAREMTAQMPKTKKLSKPQIDNSLYQI